MGIQPEMINCNDQDKLEAGQAKRFFLDKNAAGFYEWCDWSAEKGLERLVFRVSRTPKYLQGHLERIYYCYQNRLDEALYGGLVDLLIVLGQEGKALGKRMLSGTESRLTPAQSQTLQGLLQNTVSVRDLLPITRYSVFIRGLVADRVLVALTDKGAAMDQDPLTLAEEYIKYNLFDEATRTLEHAILSAPARVDLHEALAELYKNTRNPLDFKRMRGILTCKKFRLPPVWEELDKHFSQFNLDETN